MGTGYLTVQALTGDDSLPVYQARVIVSRPDGKALFETYTDRDGNTGQFPLSAPDAALTLDPYHPEPAYSVVNVDVSAKGFANVRIRGVKIEDTQLAILPVRMHPLAEGTRTDTDEYIEIGPLACILPGPRLQPGPSETGAVKAWTQLDPPETRAVVRQVYIPDYITVHLGRPDNPNVSNVRVRFADYVANVECIIHLTR